jgi:hypothetical protein
MELEKKDNDIWYFFSAKFPSFEFDFESYFKHL